MTLVAPTTLHLADIHMRDPFLLIGSDGLHRLYGTTDAQPWHGPGQGFDMYSSRDLEVWHGPVPVFRPSENFAGVSQFWAPEVHQWQGAWYMLATFADVHGGRGTYVLHSASPDGPFAPVTGRPITPPNWMCLDGTLHRADDGGVWLVFCREWLEVRVGEVWAVRLTEDLTLTEGAPIRLFRADDAPWTAPLPIAEAGTIDAYVTDGPFLTTGDDDSLVMIWSSRTKQGYAVGAARSQSGSVLGPWEHSSMPLWDEDGGHAMIARLPDGNRLLVLHTPNVSPHEHPSFVPFSSFGF